MAFHWLLTIMPLTSFLDDVLVYFIDFNSVFFLFCFVLLEKSHENRIQYKVLWIETNWIGFNTWLTNMLVNGNLHMLLSATKWSHSCNKFLQLSLSTLYTQIAFESPETEFNISNIWFCVSTLPRFIRNYIEVCSASRAA